MAERVGNILKRILPSIGLEVCPCCDNVHKGPRTLCDECASVLDTKELEACRCCGSTGEVLNLSGECPDCEARILR
jgi:hypothetical protein